MSKNTPTQKGNNYGLNFCKKGLAILAKKEKALFDAHGHGFADDSEDASEEMRFKRLQAQFEKERDDGKKPSYDPQTHGHFDDVDVDTMTFDV